jgi:peptidoglycan/xylan/chitin deacetylase (PgdA/CDA1 family)
MLGTAAAQAYSVLRKVGLETSLRDSGWRKRRLLILCWHGISLDDEHQWRPSLYISQQQFRARLKALHDGGYTVLSLDEGIARLERGELPPRSIAITFDDGFYDFAARAVPVLEEFGFPATVYLTTYYVDYQRPVFPLIISYLLWKACRPGRRLSCGTAVTTQAEAAAACSRILKEAEQNQTSAQEKDDIARKLAAELEIEYASVLLQRKFHLMTAGEVQAIAEKGKITFDAHTHRHRTPPQADLIRRELRDNKTRIEQITGRIPVHFCYPSGVFRREYFPVLEQEGFLSATTCQAGIASSRSHRYLMPRLLDHSNLTDIQYAGWLSGFLAVGRWHG